MSMQDFYQRLCVKPEQPYQRRLAGLTHVPLSQILNATSESTWFVWNAELPNVK